MAGETWVRSGSGSGGFGYGFIPPAFLPPGGDEYRLRNGAREGRAWRALSPAEREALERNGNRCPNWDDFLVCDPFDPALIRGSNFYGLVRLGTMRDRLLRRHDFLVPSGIRNSTVISCDIGDDVAVQDCAYLSHYIIGDGCILSRIDEMQTTDHAKFGNGALKDGEDEEVRVRIEVMNEAGGRSVLPFAGMIPADAYLWAAFRDDAALVERLEAMTQERYGGPRGAYGTVGDFSVIKSCAIIKDVAFGSHAYVKGANKLKNLTVLSSREEPAQIGEGVELVNGIVGYGSRVFYGSKAVRFVMGRNCGLKYGARLIHSVLGDNSTVSCCEILNSLIFPGHEQHHNNSFLIACLTQGMSNMAAAATIGSNHNSRANDGEIRAGRGFWPGLAVTLKHPSRFASFVLIAKGDYPSELDIPLPFSLVSSNVHKNRLEVMPAYFWAHNLYALERTSWKTRLRDRRAVRVQHVETDYLAPDTAEEIIRAIGLLEGWVAETGLSRGGAAGSGGEFRLRLIPCRRLENGRRGQVAVRPLEAISAYLQMLRWYSAKTLAVFLDERPGLDHGGLRELLGPGRPEERVTAWENMGGQIVPAFRVDELRRDIGSGKCGNWDEIHGTYARWLGEYPLDRARHAWAVLALLRAREGRAGTPTGEELGEEFAAALEIRRLISRRVYETRAKDFRGAFRKATFRGEAEMERVLRRPEDDQFVRDIREEGLRFEALLAGVMARLQSADT